MGKWDWIGWVGIGVVIGATIVTSKKRPNYLKISENITSHDPKVREVAIKIASKHPGSYNIEQLLDVFDYMRNLNYIDDPYPDHISLPKDTLAAGGGDCDDFAVTTASLVEAIGGRARVVTVMNNETGHAFCEVYMGEEGSVKQLESYFQQRYGNISLCWELDSGGE